jgi:hypothetical protein
MSIISGPSKCVYRVRQCVPGELSRQKTSDDDGGSVATALVELPSCSNTNDLE